MVQALSASSYVFEGVWTNEGKGSIRGLTLTVSPRNAPVVFAVLALFVQMTGSQLWALSRFVIHQYQASAASADAFDHQRQTLLRNSTTDLSIVWQFLRLGWAWRGYTRKPLLKILPLSLWAMFHFFLFAFAGIFASRVTDAGDQVLSRSPFCGGFNTASIDKLYPAVVDSSDPFLAQAKYASIELRDCQRSKSYAQSCYNVSVDSQVCHSFQRPSLSWTKNTSSSCPFKAPVCKNHDWSITLDSGFIDSQIDLGLNAPPSDRLTYRRVMDCAPLNNDEPYVVNWQNVSTGMGVNVTGTNAYYGPSTWWDTTTNASITYSYAEPAGTLRVDQQRLDFEYYFAGSENTKSFLPIPELRPKIGDLSVILLTANSKLGYSSEVDDPLFSAHLPLTFDETTFFFRDKPITALGCVELHQFRTVNEQSDLLGVFEIMASTGGISGLNLNERQIATLNRLQLALNDSVTTWVVSTLNSREAPLLATQSEGNSFSLALPNNQWELEVENWFQIGLAHLQRQVVAWSTGQGVPDTTWLNLTLTPEEAWLCQNQIIRGTPYQSFDFLALILIFISGVLVCIFSMFVDDLTFYCQWKFKRGETRKEIWENMDTLQLQRMLYETLGEGTWHDGPGDVPVAEFGEKLGILHRGSQTSKYEVLLVKQGSGPVDDTGESPGDSEGLPLVPMQQQRVYHRATH